MATTKDPLRSLQGRIAAHESWARTEDRTARTANARAALWQRFLDEANGDPIRAGHLKKAFYGRMALKSAQARRKIKEAKAELAVVEAELEAAGGEVA